MWFLIILLLANPTLAGRVTDGTRRPVSGAIVRALIDGGKPVETTTDTRGRFRLEVVGRFRLEISHSGYRTLRSAESEFPGEGVYQVEVPLLSGDPSQIDIVELDVESPETLADLQEPGAAAGLPKVDRLFGLRGGVNVTGIAEGAGQQWIAASGSVFTNSSVLNSPAFVTASPDFSAELGDFDAFDEVLPAGQNVFHGNLHYSHRNDRFNARNFFDPPDSGIPPFKYHFLGGSASGRVREGTYVFVRQWSLRINQSITRAATVPDPRWLEGDFSGVPETIVDPTTTIPFQGNRIPRERFHPQGLALAEMYPAANVPGAVSQNYRAVGKLSTAADSAGVRFDHRLTLADEASVEYQFARDTTDDPFNLLSGITNIPSFGVRDALQTHSLRINNTHVFSSDKIYTVRFSMNRLKQPRTILESAAAADPGPAVLITGTSNLGYAANLPQERRNRAYEVSNDFSWQHQRSATKLGGALRVFPFHASLDLYSRGQFQFTNGIAGHPFANLLLGYPANALRLDGNTSRSFITSTLSGFIEHSWQPFPRVAATAGMRYDYQKPFRERMGLAANFNPRTGTVERPESGLYRADRNNLGPRLGITWEAPRGVVARLGYGLFYDTLAVGDSLFLLGLNPPFVSFVLRNNGDVLPQFDIATAFDVTTGAPPPSIFSASEQLPNPYVQHWNMSIQKQVWRDIGVEVSYLGQKGTRLRRQINLNQPPPGPASSLDERRPYPEFRNIFQFETGASSIAHAGEVRVVRRFRGKYGFTAAYRYSKIIDDATLISMLPQDSYNLRGERALADFDVRHRLVFSANYLLPGAAGFPLSQGWEIQATGTFQSGTPLSAVLGTDYAGTGSPIVNRPDLVGNPRVSSPTPTRFFDPAAFAIPDSGRFGTSGRNVISGPGLQNMDIAFLRVFRASDLTRLQFRLDLYNAMNHPNFAAPPSLQNLADSPDFGALFIAGSPRILQFGLKFLW